MDPYYQQQQPGMMQGGGQQQPAPQMNPLHQQQAPPLSRGGGQMAPDGSHLMGGQHGSQQPPPAQQGAHLHQQPQSSSSGRLHHGGQAPLPPPAPSHHLSSRAVDGYSAQPLSHSQQSAMGRYGPQSAAAPSHRSAIMHQHRSSAAAISDPMAGGCITDHLAAASGPLTGSGSNLNANSYGPQSNLMGGDPYGNYPPLDYPLGQSASSGMYSQQQQQQQPGLTGGGHQSRYEGHYSGRGQRHAHLQGATTTAGAYHLDRAPDGQLLGGPQDASYALGGGGSHLRAASLGAYNPLDDPLAGSGGHLQQSMGQLPVGPHQLGGGASGRQQQQQMIGHNQMMDGGLLHHQPGGASFGAQFGSNQHQSSGQNRDLYVAELRARLQDSQNSYAAVKRELETATQKLGSSMHSIKSFWSPELKKERALRKEEATKYALVNDQMKLMRVEVQKQALLIRQLEDELRLAHETRIRTTDPDIQQHIDALCMEKESLFKENCLLRETIRELEMRLETQKQSLAARDDSIRKMVEMMNNKGIATKIMEDERMEMDRIKTRNIELEARLRHYETIIETKEKDIIKPSTSKTLHASRLEKIQHDYDVTQQKLAPSSNSPVPKQRRTKPSKAERLKSRLNAKNALPSKERLESIELQLGASSSFSSSSNSSSGVSSSKSSLSAQIERPEGETQPEAEMRLEPEAANRQSTSMKLNGNRLSGHESEVNGLQETTRDNYYKLCRCSDCRTSGQQIYSLCNDFPLGSITQDRDRTRHRPNRLVVRTPTPPTRRNAPAHSRKVVSFRSSVEQIGTPMMTQFPINQCNNQGQRMLLNDQLLYGQEEEGGSSDSLHCTKDFSLPVNGFDATHATKGATTGNGNHYDDDYLRPLDCSTPNQEIVQFQRQQPATGSSSEIVRAEVHKPPQPSRPEVDHIRPTDYTCLCSADFLCEHNYPQAATRSSLVANDLYGTTTTRATKLEPGTSLANSTEFQLSDNCVDCRNLSTYVNLSSSMRDNNNLINGADPNATMMSSNSTNSNGYGSREYRRLLRSSKQNNVIYGPTSTRGQQQQQPAKLSEPAAGSWQPQGPMSLMSAMPSNEEQLHYLSAARRLIDNCEWCKQQLAAEASGQQLATCSCPPPTQNNNQNDNIPTENTYGNRSAMSVAAGALAGAISHQVDLSRTSRSTYHTATSSSLISAAANELSVLPVNQASGEQQNLIAQQQRSNVSNKQTNGCNGIVDLQQANGIDSSLSSLFVYRHVSDDNQATTNEDEFDPDSLEISRQQQQQQPKKQVQSGGRQQARGQQQPGAWLRGRPSSEYISLSSTTSSLSAAASNQRSGNSSTSEQANHKAPGSSKQLSSSSRSTSGPLMQVGADITQSSLAKRRHLSQLNLQQQQSQQSTGGSGKKSGGCSKLLAQSKQNSRSSSNLSSSLGGNNQLSRSRHSIAEAGSQQQQTASAKTGLSIYKCFKNHLLDTISKSSASSQRPQQSTASLPRNLTTSEPSLSAPATTSGKSHSRSSSSSTKLAQMEELRTEVAKRDQELLTMNAKMKALEEQQRDSQRHIRVLKDSLVAKEEHYSLLLADVEELRRNLDERNKLIEKKSYQQTLNSAHLAARLGSSDPRLKGQAGAGQMGASHYNGPSYQELQELQGMLELRDKKINELQRRVHQLDQLLIERDSQLERVRVRFEHSTSGGGMSSGANDSGLLNYLEESLGDKEKQVALIRDQRDRAEHELNEERDSHERSIKEYKMKLNSLKFEMDKLQSRLNKSSFEGSKYQSDSYGSSENNNQSSLIKRLEFDKRSLQLEIDRLKDKLEARGAGSGGPMSSRLLGGSHSALERDARTGSALGDYSVVEFERLQEALEAQKQELRRAQAECRMAEADRKRAQEEADKLSERFERAQGEMHKLKAKLENASSERDQLLEDYERQQQLISKSQTERDCALADINQLKLDNERLQQSFNKNQLQAEKLQAQLERTQLEYKKLEERFGEASDEMRRLQAEKSSAQRELKSLEMSLQSTQLQQQRLQQEKELTRGELDKVREKHDRLEAEMERYLHEKELQQQQATMYKERLEGQQQQVAKLAKEREQLSGEMHELRERLHKQQKQQDTSELETRQEVRVWKEKYERLMGQFEKLNQDLMAKEKESQLLMDKLQRVQSEAVKLESKLEQSEMDRERQLIEVERLQQLNNKAKDEYKRWQEELAQLQEMYTKTNSKLLKLGEVEEKLRIDHDKCQMDLEVLRERYEKLQLESRKLQSERDRLQVEHERIRYDNERIQQSQGSQQATQDDFIRLSSELERSCAKLEQYQREINKLQLEKERLILDSKSMVQQGEQQYQQQLVKLKSQEEKATMELEMSRQQLSKLQLKYEQLSGDQEKLVADKERLQQQLLLLQQEVDKFRSQQSSSVQETKKLHDDEMQRVMQELETIREKYTQQRKELLQLRELQQNHEIDKDILKRELESAELRLEKLNQSGSKQKQDSERCMIEMEKMKDKIERKQQELTKAQRERNQFAQEITSLHQQIQQLQAQFEQQQQKSAGNQQQAQAQQAPQTGSQPAQGQQQQPQPQLKVEEINKLKQMLVKSEQELQRTMAENQRFKMEFENMKLQLDDAAEYISKIENDNKLLAQQNQEIIQQLKQMQQQLASQGQQSQQQASGQQQEEIKRLQEVIKKSQLELQRMVEERGKLQEMNKELQRSMEQTKLEFNSTMDQYEAELQRLQQESQQRQQQLVQQQQGASQEQQKQAAASSSDNEQLKVKLEKALDTIRAFQKTMDGMKKEIIHLNSQNKTLSEQNQSLMQTLKAEEQKLAQESGAKEAAPGTKQQEPEVRQQLARLTEMCVKLEQDLNKSQEETKQHQQVNQQLRQALDKSQGDISGLKTERDRFQAQLEKLMVELERREDQVAKAMTQQEKSGQNLQQKQGELASYQKQLDEREKALEAKREELQNLSKQIQQQRQQQQPPASNQQQQEVVVKLQQQIKSLEEERNKLRGELERVRSELKQSQTELERLLKIMSSSEEEKFKLTQQIEQLQNKLRSMPPMAPPTQQQQAAASGQQAKAAPQQQGGPQQQQMAKQQQGQQQPPQRGPQQQQRPPQQPPQQQKPTGQSQRPSGAGGFISGFFQ